MDGPPQTDPESVEHPAQPLAFAVAWKGSGRRIQSALPRASRWLVRVNLSARVRQSPLEPTDHDPRRPISHFRRLREGHSRCYRRDCSLECHQRW